MSVSLYYTARRTKPITTEEQSKCNEIAQRYDKEYPYGELYEGFCIYDLEGSKDTSEQDVIFEGATKLPSDADEDIFFDIVDWWLSGLGEILGVLNGAQWDVHLDDLNIIWSEEKKEFVPDLERQKKIVK